jgi:uncharacterized protein (TIGR04551 family)
MNRLALFAAVWCVATLIAPASARAEQADPPESPEDDGDLEDDAGGAGDDQPASAPAEDEPAAEQDCTNQADDDGDGDTDCDDYDCLDHDACYVEEDDGADPPPDPSGDGDVGADDGAEAGDDLIDVPDEEPDEAAASWAERAVDMFELHGYLRLRGDIFHNIHMATVESGGVAYDRRDEPNYYHPRPIGDGVLECDGEPCTNRTFAGANMRFRLEPVINLGDQVRILAQIDLLDNLVLGSTPEGSGFSPLDGSGTQSPWVPLRFFSGNQLPPSESNSFSDAIAVRRVWAEVTTPFGQLHFGRMGSHWGLGMMANSGNGLDDDWGDTVDRIMLATRLWGILLVPGVEFVNSGETLWNEYGGQAMDAEQLDDVTQYFLVIARRLPREEQEERLRRGDLVLNAGLYFTFRNQVLSRERIGVDAYGNDRDDAGDTLESSSSLVLRNAWAVVPDLWFQLYYRGFHIELELAYVGGDVESTARDEGEEARGNELRQFGGVVRADYTALGGQLNVGLEFGYASGDAEYEGLTPRQANGAGMTQTPNGNAYEGSSVDSLFRFDPDFNVDLILFEQILGQVAGAYYVRPWVSYEFIRNTLGIRADVVYSVAAEPMSTIGNSPHLGVEIDAAIWFRGRPPFNFTAMIQYGVLFPLSAWEDPFYSYFGDLEFPQTVQVLMAVNY